MLLAETYKYLNCLLNELKLVQ